MKKKQIIVGAIVVLLLLLAIPVYIFCDVVLHGPQVIKFNQRCERIVQDKKLIGQQPEALKAALGEPTSVLSYEEAGSFTYNYAPHPSFPFAVFQAHFENGKLNSIELYDD